MIKMVAMAVVAVRVQSLQTLGIALRLPDDCALGRVHDPSHQAQLLGLIFRVLPAQ
jgi:hypothetical protein